MVWPFRSLRFAALAVVLCAGASPSLAQAAEKLDWGVWQRIPVLHGGRLKPLDTFARETVEAICGRQRPKLSLAGATADDDRDAAELAEARKLFPDGAPRKFSAAELLLSWLAEAEKWERVPFLPAKHEQLRRELLDLPISDKQGRALRYVSPWQVAHAEKFSKRLDQLAQTQSEMSAKGERFEPFGVDQKVSELYQAYMLYRTLTFNPLEPQIGNRRLSSRLGQTFRTWNSLEPSLSMVGRFGVQERLKELIGATSESAKVLSNLFHSQGEEEQEPPLEKLEPLLVKLRDASGSLAEQFKSHLKRLLDRPPEGIEGERLEQMRVHMRTLAARSSELARQANQSLLSLYDNGQGLRILPALDPAALEKNRDEHDDAQPWLGLQAVLLGSKAALGDYPAAPLEAVREAFRQVRSAYVDRGNPDRPAALADAMEQLAAALRAAGEAVEPLRQNLPIQHRDEDLMAATAYPPEGFTNVEAAYNRFDPFLWSWVLSLAAMACFGLSFGVVRRPMFWAGIVFLLGGLLATLCGLGFRWYITGLVPATNMFETVVISALVVGALGAWFTLLPLLWPGLRRAWQMTALPGFGQPEMPATTILLLLLARFVIAAGVFVALGWMPYGSTDHAIFSLLPKTDVGSSIPTVNSLLTWSVGLCVLGLSVWYLPRAALAIGLALVTVPSAWKTQGLRKVLDQVLARKAFALVGAAVAFLAAVLAYFAPAPVFVREIGPVRPILRDNFWLLIHVLTITASYGAGALAWGLGNIALGHYLFGRYRDPAEPSPEIVARGHRPAGHYQAPPGTRTRRAPEVCATLATDIYKSTQVAVLLLIVGTILGALWADVAWGRFWGWDPKEVAALITALVYLAILHGRYAGWFGNFGLAVGSVMGATAIIVAWYGVNYVLGSGLHSYGTGTGGKLWVGLVVAANWLFMIAAAFRYVFETETPLRLPPTAASEAEPGAVQRSGA